MTLTATTKVFDAAVSSSSTNPALTSTPIGDLWLASLLGPSVFFSFAPVTINPGDTGVIYVTITPSGASGSVVSGNLYVDDVVAPLLPYGQTTGDELVAIPYSYTIK
jgi:hypothetical protein